MSSPSPTSFGIVPSPPATRAERILAKDGTGSMEHARVEFPRLAVHVDIGAREIGRDQRRAQRHRAGEKLVDKAVLRAADSGRVEPGHRQEARRDRSGRYAAS